MKNTILVLVALFVIAGFSSVAMSAEWTKKDFPERTGGLYASEYSLGGCSVMIPREWAGIHVNFREKLANGAVCDNFAIIVNGKLAQCKTERYEANAIEEPPITQAVDIPNVFIRECLPAAKDLPPEVREKFAGYFGL